MPGLMRRLGLDWLTALSALLIVLAFPPWNLSFLIWICLIPWFHALGRCRTPAQAFAQGLWLSFFMTVGGFYWIAMVLKEFGGIPWSGAILGFLLYAPFAQLQFLVFAPVARFAHRALLRQGAAITQTLPSEVERQLRPVAACLLALTLTLFYTGIDWFLPKLFRDTLGHAFYASPWLRQVADLGGAHLLTALVFAVNQAIFTVYRGIRLRRETSLLPVFSATLPQVAVTLLCLASAITYGVKRSDVVRAWMAGPHPTVRFGVVQANIGDFDKIASERGVRGAARKVMEAHFTLSDQALAMDPKPDFLLWPETSYPSTFRTPQTADELARDQMVEGFVRTRNTPLFFGGYDYVEGKDYNAFFFLFPKSSPILPAAGDMRVYRKHILLLFGEYIPGAETFGFIQRAFPQVGNFGRGVGAEAFDLPVSNGQVPSIKVGPIICYEALFPDFILEAARKGSQVILNITNDSWFGPTAEPELHLALTIFRSIESRLPQVRGTNTGISALILPDGALDRHTAIFRPEIMNVAVPILPPLPTLMMKWGDWFGLVALITGCVGLGVFAWIRRSQARQLSKT